MSSIDEIVAKNTKTIVVMRNSADLKALSAFRITFQLIISLSLLNFASDTTPIVQNPRHFRPFRSISSFPSRFLARRLSGDVPSIF
jgi:hypothetical protein